MAAWREREGEELSHLQGRFSASSLSLEKRKEEEEAAGDESCNSESGWKEGEGGKKGKEKAECVCWRQAGGRLVGSSRWAFSLFFFLGGWDQHVIFSSLKTRRRSRPCFSLCLTTTAKGERKQSLFLVVVIPPHTFIGLAEGGGGASSFLLPLGGWVRGDL